MTEQPRPLAEPNWPPFLGEPVHYVSFGTPGGEYSSTCRHAVVTAVGAWVDAETRIVAASDPAHPDRPHPMPGSWRQVWQQWQPDAVALCVMNPTGLFLNERVPHHNGRSVEGSVDPIAGVFPGGTWHRAGDCAAARP